ncbi:MULTISPECIES: uroporphyrinogen-III synthase [Photorhabdus]|uniref:Uroporphyrinogen-III synthase n=2 Tax=Photorhabdus asymbiotica TaxID=291112 RepID=C7BQI4_PHOAA|nr:uroporphyrinogen-III synthase [Photorhabdus asymbiotica]RKS60054.1 uroporphyrinogen-III synthase [Photorhabdus asymbiotica]CAQ86214.1 uroporphyrinogen-iii synthase (uros) (uroporphyrinogen-ii cosynthetase) (hydroxymethylbilane hydrolyase [cyclizing]) [Photorhabdus asymbiotica]
MSILVTRPSPAGEELVRRLQTAGKTAFSAPLIDIRPGSELSQLAEKLCCLNTGDMVFLLSKNAVYYANSQLKKINLSWPNKLIYYAIGRSTALAFHQLTGINITWSSEGETSETLLELPSLHQVKNKQALLLRGNGGRELIAQTLTERGATVNYCECYFRQRVDYSAAEFSARWQRYGVQTLVVTSGEILQLLYNLVPKSDRNRWLLNCHLIVVSERLAYTARNLGWQDVKVAKSADNDALIQALE